jgi:polyhydroxyalkanoate synthesis regulator phasin
MEEEIFDTEVEETTSEETEELDLEDSSQDEEQDEADDSEAEDVEALKARVAKLEATNKQLYARTKKGEKTPVTAQKSKSNSSITRDEAILFAKGHTEDEVELANKLAKVNGGSLMEAVNDTYFKSVVASRRKKEVASKASLGASSGSSKYTPVEVGKMTPDEHKAYFHKVMGNT